MSGRTAEGSVTVRPPPAIPKAPADDRLHALHGSGDRGSRFGAGAVMLAVDELDLEGGEERLGDGAYPGTTQWADGTPQPQLGHRRPRKPMS